jgi:hypothetical protein
MANAVILAFLAPIPRLQTVQPNRIRVLNTEIGGFSPAAGGKEQSNVNRSSNLYTGDGEMKLAKFVMSVLFGAAIIGYAVPVAAAQGKSAGHRQDGAHGHKKHKGGKSAGHRQDAGHRNSHAGDQGT